MYELNKFHGIHNHLYLPQTDTDIQLLVNFLNLLPIYISVKNSRTERLLTNDQTAQVMGFKNAHEMIDLKVTNAGLQCPVAEIADELDKQDYSVIQSNELHQSISFLTYSDGKQRILVGSKKRLHDKDSQEAMVVSIFHDMTAYPLFDANRIISLMMNNPNKIRDNQFYFKIDNDFGTFSLSNRQQECLFFWLRGYSTKDIANIMNISVKTVEFHFSSIKTKFNSLTKKDVFEKCYQYDMFNLIPISIYQKYFSQLHNKKN